MRGRMGDLPLSVADGFSAASSCSSASNCNSAMPPKPFLVSIRKRRREVCMPRSFSRKGIELVRSILDSISEDEQKLIRVQHGTAERSKSVVSYKGD